MWCSMMFTTSSTSKKTLRSRRMRGASVPWFLFECSATRNFLAKDVMFLWITRHATSESGLSASMRWFFHSSSIWWKRYFTSSVANLSFLPEKRTIARRFAVPSFWARIVRRLASFISPWSVQVRLKSFIDISVSLGGTSKPRSPSMVQTVLRIWNMREQYSATASSPTLILAPSSHNSPSQRGARPSPARHRPRRASGKRYGPMPGRSGTGSAGDWR
mmetsp:Transcript_56551/g.134383  ORF Transcript_56551/g.134383 Transcript_56551/m.134383 type:complete len:218 (+) Transcript_56551:322-975(+)